MYVSNSWRNALKGHLMIIIKSNYRLVKVVITRLVLKSKVARISFNELFVSGVVIRYLRCLVQGVSYGYGTF